MKSCLHIEEYFFVIWTMKKFFQTYGRYFFVLPLILTIREWYVIIFSETGGDWFNAIMLSGFTYYFYGMSIGKFKYKEQEEEE